MAAKETPLGIALLLCDEIILDATTRKRSLIGIFSSVNAKAFPATLHKLCVLASLTQIYGDLDIRLVCHNETTGDAPILSLPARAHSEDPNAVLDLAFEFGHFSFPNAGLYSVELRGDEAIILSTRVTVTKMKPPEQG